MGMAEHGVCLWRGLALGEQTFVLSLALKLWVKKEEGRKEKEKEWEGR